MTSLIRQPLAPSESNDFQTELKFVAPAHRTQMALRMLARNCDPDEKYPIGVVSSIYYDTPNWDLLREKRDSDYLKSKIRLRWYEQTEAGENCGDSSYAEAKYRVGSRRVKFRIPTNLSGRLLAGTRLDTSLLRQIPDQLAARGAPVPQPILPAFVVRYRRHRFVDRLTGTRICLDYDIRSPRTNPMMLAAPFPCRLPVSVLEVKGTDSTIPLFLRNLLKLGFRKESFSKYYECYGRLTRTFF